MNYRRILLSAVVIVSVAASDPPKPPTRANVLQSPKAAARFFGKSSTAAIAPIKMDPLLVWDFDTNSPDWNLHTVFDVWHIIDQFSTNVVWGTNDDGTGIQITNVVTLLTNWHPYASITGALSCSITVTQNADFFRARTLDTWSGIYSPWNTK